mmetsp:Transcript_3857/g.10294  ORF Transcript_3857/g.10294 Transcript_3857/m.10294 type:complete len:223 (-) Transcript_3857:32-700(-)
MARTPCPGLASSTSKWSLAPGPSTWEARAGTSAWARSAAEPSTRGSARRSSTTASTRPSATARRAPTAGPPSSLSAPESSTTASQAPSPRSPSWQRRRRPGRPRRSPSPVAGAPRHRRRCRRRTRTPAPRAPPGPRTRLLLEPLVQEETAALARRHSCSSWPPSTGWRTTSTPPDAPSANGRGSWLPSPAASSLGWRTAAGRQPRAQRASSLLRLLLLPPSC